MTEDRLVDILCTALESRDWRIDKVCKGRTRGIDIQASKRRIKLLIECKGARGSPAYATREMFTISQMRSHLGVALVKILEEEGKSGKSGDRWVRYAIAHPDDADLRRVLGPAISQATDHGFSFLWVSASGRIRQQGRQVV